MSTQLWIGASVALIIPLSTLSLSADPSSPKDDSVTRGRGQPFYPFTDIEPKPIGAFQDIPERVRSRLHSHLLERFGARYLSRLNYVGGYVSEVEELPLRSANRYAPGMKIPKYFLSYELTVPPELGIRMFVGDIGLDGEGAIVEEIDLPPTAKHPEKEKMTSLRSAYATASALGFLPAETEARISYDRGLESIVFELDQALEKHGHYTLGRKAIIDVHTGLLVRIDKTAINIGPCHHDREPLCVWIDDKGNIGFGGPDYRRDGTPGR
jgi:hypothetical protein